MQCLCKILYYHSVTTMFFCIASTVNANSFSWQYLSRITDICIIFRDNVHTYKVKDYLT